MRTYLVFEPAGGARDEAGADRVVFLREKFSWPALFFAPLWLLWHRLWLGLFGWFAAIFALALAAFLLDLDPRAAALVLWLPTLVLAFEASELRRRKLVRRGLREAGVVVGENLDDAERRFFAQWVRAAPLADAQGGRRPAPRADAPPLAPGGPGQTNQVIGLFPEPGARR